MQHIRLQNVINFKFQCLWKRFYHCAECITTSASGAFAPKTRRDTGQETGTGPCLWNQWVLCPLPRQKPSDPADITLIISRIGVLSSNRNEW